MNSTLEDVIVKIQRNQLHEFSISKIKNADRYRVQKEFLIQEKSRMSLEENFLHGFNMTPIYACNYIVIRLVLQRQVK